MHTPPAELELEQMATARLAPVASPAPKHAPARPPYLEALTLLGDALASRGLVLPWFAAGGVATLGQLLNGAIEFPLAAAAWLVCYASYLIDSASEGAAGSPASDAASASARCAHQAGHRRTLAVAGGTAFAIAMTLTAWRAGFQAAAALLMFPGSVALYCLPLPRSGLRCIKDIPYAKTFYTAFFWGLLGAWAAASLGHAREPAVLATAFVLFALRDWVNTVFCDLKDLARDQAQGVRTLAARLGPQRLLSLLAAVNLALPPLLVLAVAAGTLPPQSLGLSLTTLYFHAVLKAARRTDAPLERLCTVVADAEWVLWPLYIALANLFLD